MFLKNGCIFYERYIIVLNIVLSKNSEAQIIYAVNQRDFGKV